MDDFRRLSTYQPTGISTDIMIEKSTQPVTLYDFKIHPEQCGYEIVGQQNSTAILHTTILEEFAANQAAQIRRRRLAYEKREEKRRTKFKKS
jgi:hypothetical protein